MASSWSAASLLDARWTPATERRRAGRRHSPGRPRNRDRRKTRRLARTSAVTPSGVGVGAVDPCRASGLITACARRHLSRADFLSRAPCLAQAPTMGTLLLSRHQSLPSVHSSMADHHDPSRPRPSQQPAPAALRPTVVQGENNAHQLDKATKKRLLQQCHKEIRQFIGEREHADVKIGTVEALHKTLQLLRSTAPHGGETSETTTTRESSSTDRTVAVVDAWSDSHEAASFSDDAWSMAPDFNDRLLVTVKVSLPDGAIVDLRKVASDQFDCEVVEWKSVNSADAFDLIAPLAALTNRTVFFRRTGRRRNATADGERGGRTR